MENVEGALAALCWAMENEKKGYLFYVGAAQRSPDPGGQGTLRDLARAEEDHLKLLLVEYESVCAGEGWIEPKEAMARDVVVDITKPLFAGDTVNADDDAPFADTWAKYEIDTLAGDLAVLELGMEMERKFYRKYKEAAEAADDPAERSGYEFLLGEENRHYVLLQEAHDYLSDNKHWWDDWELPFFEG